MMDEAYGLIARRILVDPCGAPCWAFQHITEVVPSKDRGIELVVLFFVVVCFQIVLNVGLGRPEGPVEEYRSEHQ